MGRAVNEPQCSTPVAFIIYNRPEITARVFQAIRAARPRTLLVIADGPRAEDPRDQQRCAAARAIIDGVDWPCEVLREFSPSNMGCGARVSSGISWVFDQVEHAIILEDDCLPSRSFFIYCSEMLTRFADDRRIMEVTGANLVGDWKPQRQSYHFAYYYCAIWGWASWRRAWRSYDFRIANWADPHVKRELRRRLGNNQLYRYRAWTLDMVHDGKVDTWDYQWSFARLLAGGLSVVPSRNLVSNIGFGADATHTLDPLSRFANLPAHELEFPVRHPDVVARDAEYDLAYFKLTRGDAPAQRGLMQRIATRAKALLG